MSNNVHVIRLRGPWWWAASVADGSSVPVRINFGATAAEICQSDVWFGRNFNTPSGLSRFTKVHLVIDQVECLRAVEIDGAEIWSAESGGGPAHAVHSRDTPNPDACGPSPPRLRLDLSQIFRDSKSLQAHALRLHVQYPAPQHPRLTGSVALEIEETGNLPQ